MLLGLFPVYLFVPFIAAYVTTDRAFVAQLLTISLFVLIALWIFRTAFQSQLKVSTFFQQGASIGRAGLIGLVLALFVFSLGASSVTFARAVSDMARTGYCSGRAGGDKPHSMGRGTELVPSRRLPDHSCSHPRGNLVSRYPA